MSKIAIFGGSFDPVHKAHVQIARNVLENFNFQKLIFVVTYKSPHKNKQYADVKDRITMLKLATKNLGNIEISLFEAEKRSVMYSYQTLDYFQSCYPLSEIFMVIGLDSLVNLPTWNNVDYLTSKYKFIVVNRLGVDIDVNTKYLNRCFFINNKIDGFSSTEVRYCLKNDKTKVSEMLCADIYNYILENGLYR